METFIILIVVLMSLQTLPAYIRQNPQLVCVQKIKIGKGTIKPGDPYPFALRQLSSFETLPDGTTRTVFNSYTTSIPAQILPLTILETPVEDPAQLSTFIPNLLIASYPVGGQGDDFISTNPDYSHKLYRYFRASPAAVKALILSTIEKNLFDHREELIVIARRFVDNEEQAEAIINNIGLHINPKTPKIVRYAAPESPLDENVAPRNSHKDSSEWHSTFWSRNNTIIVRR